MIKTVKISFCMRELIIPVSIIWELLVILAKRVEIKQHPNSIQSTANPS